MVLKTFRGFPPRSINYRSDYPGPSTFQVAHSNFTSGTIMDKFEDPDAHFKSSWTNMRIWEKFEGPRCTLLCNYSVIWLPIFLKFSLKSDIFSSLTVQFTPRFDHICRYSRPLPH